MKTQLILTTVAFLALSGCGSSSGGGDTINPGNLLSQSDQSGVYTLKGNVLLEDNQFSDSDTNANPGNANSNDTFDSAQLIANQSVVNGYLGTVGGSADGNDFYKIQLVSGDEVRVTYSGDAPSLTVMTYDGTTGTTVAAGVVSGSNQLAASVAASQVFYINVVSTGETQYILQTGQITENFASKINVARNMDDFVPGEVVVKFKGKVSTDTAQRQVISSERPRLMSLTDFSGDVAYRRGSPAASLKQQTLDLVDELNMRPDVEYAAVNNYYYPASVPNDEYYNVQWNMHAVNAFPSWQYQGNNDVVVAVIDSGIARISDNGGLRDHIELEGKLVSGFDFIEDLDIANDGDGIDADPTDTGDTDFNSSYHGTHVAGIIVAKANNGVGVVGVAGASANIKVMPIRVFGKDQRTTAYALSQAILFAAGEISDADEIVSDRTNAGGVHDFTPRAQVINMSLGGSLSAVVFDAIQKARQAGVILIAAAGNSAMDASIFYPAAYDGVVSVAATDEEGKLASYSNFGASIDVSAPGGDRTSAIGEILSTYATGRSSVGVAESYQYAVGTSMAAPVVAGVVALMKSVDPSLSSSDIYSYISSGDIVDPVSNPLTMGYGSINALKAVSEVSGVGVVDANPILKATPTSVYISYKQQLGNVLLYNGGTNLTADELKIKEFVSTSTGSDVPENERWLLATKANEKTLGILNLYANKISFSNGVYTDTVTVTSSENIITVPVRMEINRELKQFIEPLTVYLFALNEEGAVTSNLIRSSAVSRSDDGVYSYSIEGVPKGSYYLTAGSNSNGNETRCDGGELCSVNGELGSRIVVVGSGLKANLSVTTNAIDVP